MYSVQLEKIIKRKCKWWIILNIYRVALEYLVFIIDLCYFNVPEKYLELSLSEKRKHYKCGQNFVTLEHVETWPKYFAANKDDLKIQCKWSSFLII